MAAIADPRLPPAGPGKDTGKRSSTLTAALFAYSTQVIVAALTLLNVLVVARALGPSGRGDVVFLITVAILSSQVASLSVSEAISVHAGREPERRASLASNAAILAVVLGLAAAVALALLKVGIPGIGPHVSAGLWALTLVSIVPLILQEYLSRLAMAEYRFAVANLAFAVPALVQVFLNGALYAAGELTVGRAMLAWVCGQALSLTVLIVAVLGSGAGFGRPDPTLGRGMIGFGLKAHGSRSLQWGNYRLDQWLVGALAGSTELGLYSVAVAWAEGLFLLPQAIAIVQRPDLVRDDAKDAGRRAARGFRLVILSTVPLVLGLLVLAPFLCVTIFGAEFGGSVAMLRILAVGRLRHRGDEVARKRADRPATAGARDDRDRVCVRRHAGAGRPAHSRTRRCWGGGRFDGGVQPRGAGRGRDRRAGAPVPVPQPRAHAGRRPFGPRDARCAARENGMTAQNGSARVRPAFILSLPRTGSTLLQRILGSHAEIGTSSEPWFLLPQLYALRERGVHAEYEHETMARGTRGFAREYLPGGEDAYLRGVHDLAIRVYAEAAPGKTYFLDKTPRYHHVARDLFALFPEAKFVFLWRHPVAVAASMIETFGHGRWNLDAYSADLFGGLAHLVDAYAETGDRAIALRYEELVTEPEVEIRRVLRYLGLSDEDTAVDRFQQLELRNREYWDPTGPSKYAHVSADSVSQWKRTFANPLRREWARRYVRWIGRERLTLMGYELDAIMAEIEGVPFGLRRLGPDTVAAVAGYGKRRLRSRILGTPFPLWRP